MNVQSVTWHVYGGTWYGVQDGAVNGLREDHRMRKPLSPRLVIEHAMHEASTWLDKAKQVQLTVENLHATTSMLNHTLTDPTMRALAHQLLHSINNLQTIRSYLQEMSVETITTATEMLANEEPDNDEAIPIHPVDEELRPVHGSGERDEQALSPEGNGDGAGSQDNNGAD